MRSQKAAAPSLSSSRLLSLLQTGAPLWPPAASSLPLSLRLSMSLAPSHLCRGGQRGGAPAHILCEALLLLVLPDVAALCSVLASFCEQKVCSLLRRSDIITAAAHRKFWAPRRQQDFLKPAPPQTKCVHLKLQGATLGLSVEPFNE